MKTDEELFDASHLRPLDSLNRRQVIALPGVEAEAIGKTGYELLSKWAMIELIQPCVRGLGLDGIQPGELLQHLHTLLETQDKPKRTIAEAIAKQYGRRLGCLIASILLSPNGLTSPLEPWEAAYLDYWKMEVREFVLGGGLSNGRFGNYIRPVVESVLVQCRITDRRMSVSECPSYLPLIGAARSIPWEVQGEAVVVDFGSTRAKRGIAFFDEDNTLSRLQTLPTKDITDLTGPGKTTELAAAMINLITDAINQVSQGAPLVPKIMCSVAAFVEDGEPVKINRGAYTSLDQLSPRIADWFSERISQAAGVKVEVDSVHDCDVAACALAGRLRSAVLMLGSALGVGFVPPAAGCRPLADDFAPV